MKKIKLNGKYGQGKYALVDNEDYESLNQYYWRCTPLGYAIRGYRTLGTYTNCFMHNVILSHTPTKNAIIDHINLNPLDNRKANLRITTKANNIRNRYKQSNNHFNYKGVRFHKGSWYAQICLNRKFYHLGLFRTDREAAHVYNQFAEQLFGEYARLNEL